MKRYVAQESVVEGVQYANKEACREVVRHCSLLSTKFILQLSQLLHHTI